MTASDSGHKANRILVDCGRPPLREWLTIMTMAILSCAAVIVVVLRIAPQLVPLSILTGILALTASFWFFRPAHTLLREDGIHAPNAQAQWDEVVHWEIYDASRVLSLTVRSDLIRIDQLTLDVRLYQNQVEAERVLREHVPNGRVVP
jgi:hypothetical protein